MKKIFKIISVFSLCFVIIVVMYAFFTTPVNRYNLKDCSVSVLNYDHSEILCELTDEQRDKFIDILTDIDINESISVEKTSLLGMNYGYEIKLTNGKTIKVSVSGEYLTIDDKTYLCELASSSDLAEFAEDAFRQYYPVNK